jgi:hypothetical protein
MPLTRTAVSHAPRFDNEHIKRVSRRSYLRWVSRCLIVVSLPIASLPDALTSRGDAAPREIAQDGTSEERARSGWSGAMDHELTIRWTAFQASPLIAREMHLPTRVVRTRATRLGLPARQRDAIVWS